MQNKLDLLMADVATGASRVVLHEEDPHWINVSGEPRVPRKRRAFSVDQRALRLPPLYLYGIDGKHAEATDQRRLGSRRQSPAWMRHANVSIHFHGSRPARTPVLFGLVRGMRQATSD